MAGSEDRPPGPPYAFCGDYSCVTSEPVASTICTIRWRSPHGFSTPSAHSARPRDNDGMGDEPGELGTKDSQAAGAESARRPRRYVSYLYILCMEGEPRYINDRDFLDCDPDSRNPAPGRKGGGSHPISHYVGTTGQDPPTNRALRDHGVPMKYLVALEPGGPSEEHDAKLNRACPRCGGSLWYFAESPTYPGPIERAEFAERESRRVTAGTEPDSWLKQMTADELKTATETARTYPRILAIRLLRDAHPGMGLAVAAALVRHFLAPDSKSDPDSPEPGRTSLADNVEPGTE